MTVFFFEVASIYNHTKINVIIPITMIFKNCFYIFIYLFNFIGVKLL